MLHGINAIVYDNDLILDGENEVKGATLNDKVYKFGNSQKDFDAETELSQNTVVLKVNGDIIINKDVTLTSCESEKENVGPKGLIIYCTGTITNNGEISMTGRGAKADGQNVYIKMDENGMYEFIPGVGGKGAGAVSVTAQGSAGSQNKTGNPGGNGENKQTGGGASGSAYAVSYAAVWVDATAISGNGGAGTSYSGGVAGENVSCVVSSNENSDRTLRGKGGSSTGGNLAGGLLIIMSNIVDNSNGKITANSLTSGNGGGSINIFIKKDIKEGIIEANGKGNGGKGTYNITKIEI